MNRPKVKVQDKDKQCKECHGTGKVCEYSANYVNCEHICPMCRGSGEMPSFTSILDRKQHKR